MCGGSWANSREGDLALLATDPPDQLDAVVIRQVDVADHRIGRLAVRERERLVNVGRRRAGETGACERRAEGTGDLRIGGDREDVQSFSAGESTLYDDACRWQLELLPRGAYYDFGYSGGKR